MKPKVYLTRLIHDEGLKLLHQHFYLTVNPLNRNLTKGELMKNLKDQHGLVCLLSDMIDKEILDSADKLVAISNYAVGFNNIDVDYATELGIIVTNTPGVLTEATADLTWALIMAISRKIIEADKFTRMGYFKGWEPMLFLGSPVYGKTLGIIGMGRIGKAVAHRAKGFNMDIIYYSRSKLNKNDENNLRAHYADLKELLNNSDFVSIHLPLTKETYHLIGKNEFKLMKPTAFLINTSRGPIVDEEALVEALKNNLISGAALDVYENEPKIHPALLELNNVILLPHIGSATVETRKKMAVMAAENLISIFEGKKIENIVNPQVWNYRRKII